MGPTSCLQTMIGFGSIIKAKLWRPQGPTIAYANCIEDARCTHMAIFKRAPSFNKFGLLVI